MAKLTPGDIQKTLDEIEVHKQQSIDLAASNPTLSAYYWGLFTVGNRYKKRFAKMKVVLEGKEAAEQRAQRRKGTAAPGGAASQSGGRTRPNP
jgi:hypothetical protein